MNTNKTFTHLIAIIAIIVFAFGCKTLNVPSFGGGISESSDPKETVRNAYKKFMNEEFYHSVVTTKNSKATVVMELDYSAPDKFWIKNQLPNMKSEVIAIGSESFNRINDGKWTKIPDGQGLPVSEMRKSMSETAFESMSGFESLGKESLDGKDTYVFKFKSSYGGESSSKMWVSAESELPVKVETEGTIANTQVQMSITYAYDKEVQIEKPTAN